MAAVPDADRYILSLSTGGNGIGTFGPPFSAIDRIERLVGSRAQPAVCCDLDLPVEHRFELLVPLQVEGEPFAG